MCPAVPIRERQVDGLTYYDYRGQVIAARGGDTLVVRRHPLSPAHPDWRALDDWLDRLDGGSVAAYACRLDAEAFVVGLDRLRQASAGPCPIAETVLTSLVGGEDVCAAHTPADRWPGTDAPLGRVGYWVGTAAAQRFLGASDDDFVHWWRAHVAELKAAFRSGILPTPEGT
jgi:hypothetical protein